MISFLMVHIAQSQINNNPFDAFSFLAKKQKISNNMIGFTSKTNASPNHLKMSYQIIAANQHLIVSRVVVIHFCPKSYKFIGVL